MERKLKFECDPILDGSLQLMKKALEAPDKETFWERLKRLWKESTEPRSKSMI